MKTIILLGKEILSIDELHAQLKEKLELPDYYGANLDALWDCLTGWVSLPLTIEWYDFSITERLLGDQAGQVMTVFKDAATEIDGFKIVIC